jgi:lipopolysaccharide transport system ATP-binding protein
VSRKLDAIVDFAGVERFLDTPVKRYSSGMHVRLGFAVAAYLESEILVVDEVLAVGDAAFQKKAKSKIESVSQNDGRTVLFVSHNMQSIKKLCNSAICLDQGKIIYQGSIADTINSYIKKNEGDISNNKSLLNKPRTGNRMLYFTSIEFEDEDGNEIGQIVSGEPLGIRLSYECNGLVDQNSFLLDMRINDESGMEISSISTDPRGIKFNEFKKTGYIMVFFKKLCLMGGEYSIDINASVHFGTRISLDCVNNAANLTVHPGKNGSVGYAYLECDITN